MVPLDELPYPVLGRIIRFLSLADVISVSEVCQSWKQVALISLRTVRIDESTVYGGSWQKYYQQNNETTRVGHFDKFARDLANLTDKIEHLYFDGNDIPLAVFEILLSSQKELKTLVVNLESKGTFDGPRTEIGKAITRGIVRNQNSLEKINIGAQCVFLSFKPMAYASKDKDSCFPNLKSIEFLSTAVGDLDLDYYDDDNDDVDYCVACDNDHDNDVYHAINEFESAELLFKKMFNGPKIEELNYKPKKPLSCRGFYKYIFWRPCFIQLLRNYFQLGAFFNLRKINIDSLNTRRLVDGFSEADADLLIKNCPHISHIDSDLSFTKDIDNYRCFTAVNDEKPFLKIIKHYGSQLVHLHCYTSTNIAKCIVENSPNVRTLTITEFFANEISESALIALSGLEKLKKVTIVFRTCASVGFLVFLQNCVNRLIKLQIFFEVTFAETGEINLLPNIFQIIQRNGKNLETFIFHGPISSLGEYKDVMNACTEMLSGFLPLKCLILEMDTFVHVDRTGKIWRNHIKKLAHVLASYHADLHHLGLYPLDIIPNKIKQTLIKRMPYCKMQFDNCFDNYDKF